MKRNRSTASNGDITCVNDHFYFADARSQKNTKELCQPVSSVSGRRRLRSARRGELDFPRVNLATYGERAFAYTDPTSWNLTDSITFILLCKPSNAISILSYFPHTSRFNAFEVSYENALYKSTVIMVALCNRADHYIFALWFLLLSFFFPRLISAAAY